MTLGERIIKLRNSKGISQDTLANALGVSRQSVSKWETDASVPELDKLIKLSEYFEISLDELIQRKGGAEVSESSPEHTSEASCAEKVLADKKKKWFQIITLLLCLVLFIIVIGQKRAIKTLNESMRYHLAMEMTGEKEPNDNALD